MPALSSALYQCAVSPAMTTGALPEKGVALGTLAHGVDDLVGGALAEQGTGQVPLGRLGKRGSSSLRTMRSRSAPRAASSAETARVGLGPAGQDQEQRAPLVSEESSSVRRSEVGSAQCRSSKHEHGGAVGHEALRQSATQRRKGRPLQLLGAQPGEGRRSPCPGPRPITWESRPAIWSSTFGPKDRLHGPLQGRTGNALHLLPGPRPPKRQSSCW